MDLQRLHQGEWFELGVFTFDVERTSTVTMSIINREYVALLIVNANAAPCPLPLAFPSPVVI